MVDAHCSTSSLVYLLERRARIAGGHIDGTPLTRGSRLSNSVHFDVVCVDIKVDPVEEKGLHQAENSFSKKRIDIVAAVALKKDANDRVTEHQRDKSIGALDSMLNIGSRIILHPLVNLLANLCIHAGMARILKRSNVESLARHVKYNGDPNKGQEIGRAHV